MSSREFQERLARRARRAGLTIRPELGAQLEIYYRLLSAWNSKINLTGLNLSDYGPESLDRLLIEPLVAAAHVRPAVRSLLDIGSGGGSPAIPLALALSDISLLMVEAKTRKSVFLREALRALGLSRGDVVTARFEELLTKPRATRSARFPHDSSRANRVARAHESPGLRSARRRDFSVSNVSRCPRAGHRYSSASLEGVLSAPGTGQQPRCA